MRASKTILPKNRGKIPHNRYRKLSIESVRPSDYLLFCWFLRQNMCREGFLSCRPIWQIYRAVKDKGGVAIYDARGTLIGGCVLYRNARGVYELGSLVLVHAFRGQTLVPAILSLQILRCYFYGERVWAEVRRSNRRILTILKSAGWREVSAQRDHLMFEPDFSARVSTEGDACPSESAKLAADVLLASLRNGGFKIRHPLLMQPGIPEALENLKQTGFDE